MNFNFLMMSQYKTYFNDIIRYVKLFSYYNKLEIYSKHTPLLLFIEKTIIKIYKNKCIYFYINKGFLEFRSNKLILLINKLIKFNSLNKKKYTFKKNQILSLFKKKNIYKNNLDKFLKLNFKLNNYNNFLYFYKKIKR